MNESNLDKLSKLGTDAVASVIRDYTVYCLQSAICSVLLCCIMIVVCVVAFWHALKLYRSMGKNNLDKDPTGSVIVMLIAGAIGLAFMAILFCSVPDLLNPHAAAISKLLTELKGK